MTSLTEFFNKHEDDALKGITHKNSIIKRNIIAHMAVNGECTLSELTKELHISVPTITKLVQEPRADGAPTSSAWPTRQSISPG